jgi:hypothetical protein
MFLGAIDNIGECGEGVVEVCGIRVVSATGTTCRWDSIGLRVYSEYMLAPELGELATTLFVERRCLDFRSNARVKPCKSMDMGASTALELVPEPIIRDSKLRYEDVLHELAEP